MTADACGSGSTALPTSNTRNFYYNWDLKNRVCKIFRRRKTKLLFEFSTPLTWPCLRRRKYSCWVSPVPSFYPRTHSESGTQPSQSSSCTGIENITPLMLFLLLFLLLFLRSFVKKQTKKTRFQGGWITFIRCCGSGILRIQIILTESGWCKFFPILLIRIQTFQGCLKSRHKTGLIPSFTERGQNWLPESDGKFNLCKI